jgi:hypothetical protein
MSRCEPESRWPLRTSSARQWRAFARVQAFATGLAATVWHSTCSWRVVEVLSCEPSTRQSKS